MPKTIGRLKKKPNKVRPQIAVIAVESNCADRFRRRTETETESKVLKIQSGSGLKHTRDYNHR